MADSAPWEDYGGDKPAVSGPWSDYASSAAVPAAPAPQAGDLRQGAAGFGEALTALPGTIVNGLNPMNYYRGARNAVQDIAGAGADVYNLGVSGALQHWQTPEYGQAMDALAAKHAAEYHAAGNAVTHALNTSLGYTGLNPEDVPAPATWDQRLARNLGATLPALAIPTGAGGVMANLARNALPTLGAGVGKDVAEEVAPEGWKQLAGLAGSLGGGWLGATVPGLARPFAGNPQSAATLADFNAEGIRPLAGPILGNKTLTTAESTLAKAPGAGGVYENALNQIHSGLENRIGDVASKYGLQDTPEAVGTMVTKGAKEASGRFRSTQQKLYDDALQPVLGVKPRTLSNLENLGADWFKELNAAPESLSGTTGTVLNRLNGVLRDTGSGNMTLDALRRIRTGIGRDLDDPVLAGVSGAQQPYLRKMYGALSDDIKQVATDADPSIASKLALADRYTRLNSKRLDLVQDLIGGKTGGQLYQAMVNSGKTGGASLRAFRNTLKPDQWDTVAGTTLGRMGFAKPGAQAASGIAEQADSFSPSTFLTNWSQLAPEAKQALFGGTRYSALQPSLDRLVRIIDKVKGFNTSMSGSPTFERNARFALMGGMGTTALGGLMRGDLIGAAAEPGALFLGGYVAPKLAARLMTEPKFINWLANRAVANTPTAAARSSSVLRALAASSPAISDYLSAIDRHRLGAP